jgi:hypothetical protein
MKKLEKPKESFDRKAIFASVDESNKRFEMYSKSQRKEFYRKAKSLMN